MSQTYWAQATRHRITRRRALSASGAGVASALILAACGGSDSGGKGDSKPVSGLVSPVLDETKSVKRGGTMKSAQGSPITLDPHQTSAGVLAGC